MIPEFDFITLWLTDTILHGTAILVIAIAALSSIKQPARRMPVAWGAFAGLVALAILPALSWWPRVELPVWHSTVPAHATAKLGKLASDESEGADLVGRDDTLPAEADISILPPDVDSATNLEGVQNIEIESIAMNSSAKTNSAIVDELDDINFAANNRRPLTLSSDPENAAAEWRGTFPSWQSTTTGLWLAGALLVTIWIAAGAWRTERLFRRSHAAPGWVRDDLRQIVPAHRREPRTRVSQEIAAALAYGAIRPAILLRDPQSCDAPNEPEARRGIRAALAHEYAHIAHGDLWLLALERLLLPVYFAHPLFWVLRRWIRIDQELLADAAAAADRPVEYAEGLLKWAKSAPAAGSSRFSAALPLWSSPCHLKRRIEMLLDLRNPIVRHASTLWHGAVLTTIMAFVVCVSLVTLRPTSGVAQTAPDRSAEEQSADAAATGATAAPAASPPVVSDAGNPAGSDSAATNPRDKPNPGDAHPADAARADDADDPALRKTFSVQLNIVMMQVDHAELTRLGTSLSRLAAETCVVIHESRTKENILGVHTSAECSQKLVEALKARRAAKLETERQIHTAIETGPKTYPSPAAAQADDGMEFKQDFKHSKSSLRLAAKLVRPASGGIMYVKLNVSGGQDPKVVGSKNGVGELEISSTRKIGYASLVKVGQSLLIVDDSADSESDPQTDRVSLIIVSPVKVERMPDSEPESGSSHELEALRKVVEELKQEIRGLRDQPQNQSLQGPGKAAGRDSPDARHNIDQELLRLDVQEAEVIVSAANTAYEIARQAKDTNTVSPAEVANRLAALRKAQIALQRVKLRAEQIPLPAAPAIAGVNGTVADQTASLAEKLRELEAPEAQADLDAARAAYDHAVSLHNNGSLGASELAARKLAVQKAEIALRRVKLRIEAARNPSTTLKANPEPAVAADEADRTLIITVTMAEGQVPKLALLSPKLNEEPLLAGPFDADCLAALDRRLKQLVAVEGQPFDHILIRAQRNLKHGELVKVIDICKNAGKPLKISFVAMPETLPKPDTDLSNLDSRPEQIQKQKLNIKSLESQLEAAKRVVAQFDVLSRTYTTPTAGSPTGVVDGFQFSPPLGLRNATAQVRNAELRLAKASEVLAAMEAEIASSETTTPPAATDAAQPRDDAFWQTRQLEQQLTSPLLAPSSARASTLPLPNDEKAVAELAALLAEWAKAASQIQRLHCTFTRFNYDNRRLHETRAAGAIVVDAPDRAYYDLCPTNVYRLKSRKLKPDGTPYDLRTEPRELAWLWAGRRVLHLDVRGKTYTAAPLPAGDQPPFDADLFILARPFLLGMPAADLLQRFAVSLKRSDNEQVWLSFIPRQPQAPYREAVLLLSRGDWRPRALKLVDSTGEVESVHVFEKFAVNSAEHGSEKEHLLDLAEMNIPGFREIMHRGDAPQPGDVPPGTDAVFQTRQERLANMTLETLGLSTAQLNAAEFPAALASRFRGGLKVTAVAQGGLADAAGIRPNDILVGLHNWETSRQQDLHYAVRQLATMELGTDSADTNGISAYLIRNGEVVKTTINLKTTIKLKP